MASTRTPQPAPARPRAFIYARQSQKNEASIQQQTRAGRDRFAEQGWTNAGEFADRVSASRYGTKVRDDWPKVLKGVQEGKADLIWLFELSRGDRQLTSFSQMLDTCIEYGVKICIESHDGRIYDPRLGIDKKTLGQEMLDAEYESYKTSVRVNRDTRTRAAEGKAHGQVPDGYRREHEMGLDRRGHQTMIVKGQFPDEPRFGKDGEPVGGRALVAREIITRLATGEPVASVRRSLNDYGVPVTVPGWPLPLVVGRRRRPRTKRVTDADGKLIEVIELDPQPWTDHAVRNLAVNVAYIAKRVHVPGRHGGGIQNITPDAQVYPGDWEPLVGEDVFWVAHAILTGEGRDVGKGRPGGARYLLSRIPVCGKCGGIVKSGRYSHLDMRCYKCENQCVSIPMDDLDEFIWLKFAKMLADPANLHRLAAAQADSGDAVKGARAELDEAEHEYQALMDAADAKQISDETLFRLEPGRIARRDAARARLAELEIPPVLRLLTDCPARDAYTRLRAAPLPAQRAIIRYMTRITLKPAVRRGPRGPVGERVNVDWLGGNAREA